MLKVGLVNGAFPEVGVELGVDRQQPTTTEGEGRGDVGTRIGAFGDGDGAGVVPGQAERDDQVVEVASGVEGVSEQQQAVTVGKGRSRVTRRVAPVARSTQYRAALWE